METEAKFSFREPAAFDGWRRRFTLGPFILGSERTVHVVDAYVDGPGHECFAAGYACRIRRVDGRYVATLKSLADAEPGGHPGIRRREELEVELTPPSNAETVPPAEGDSPLPTWQQPAAWPESEARTLALRLLDGRPLRRLATLRQERHERDVLGRGRRLAVLSLDRVHFDDGRPEMLELEVELTDEGREAELQELVAFLQSDPAFEPAPRSKLQRALDGAGITVDERTAEGSTMPAAGVVEPVGADRPVDRSGETERSTAPTAGGVRDRATDDGLHDVPEGEADASMAGSAAATDPIVLALRLLRATAGPRADDVWVGPPVELEALTGALSAAQAAGVTIEAFVAGERRLTLTVSGADAGAKPARRLRRRLRQALGLKVRLETLPEGRRPPACLRYDATLASSGRTLLAVQHAAAAAAEPGVRGGDEDALHDMRVAVRRMRTLLRLLRRAYPRYGLRALTRGLGQLGDRLGAVRDLDVLIGRVAVEAAELSEQDGIELLLGRLHADRDKARQKLLAFLDGDGYRDAQQRLQTFLASDTADDRGEERTCDAVPVLVWRRYGTVRAYAPRVEEAGLKELHELRKDTKRLRYAIEFFAPLLGEETGDLVSRTVAVQDALGELHDAAVLVEILDRQINAGVDGLGVMLLHDLTLVGLAEQRRAFETLWPRLNGRNFRRRLGDALAEL